MYHLHFKLNKFPNTDGRNLENEEGKGSNLKFGRSEETSACLLCPRNGGSCAPPREDTKKAETDRLVSAFFRCACRFRCGSVLPVVGIKADRMQPFVGDQGVTDVIRMDPIWREQVRRIVF